MILIRSDNDLYFVNQTRDDVMIFKVYDGEELGPIHHFTYSKVDGNNRQFKRGLSVDANIIAVIGDRGILFSIS